MPCSFTRCPSRRRWPCWAVRGLPGPSGGGAPGRGNLFAGCGLVGDAVLPGARPAKKLVRQVAMAMRKEGVRGGVAAGGRWRAAFTLVELLVVIAIIALLMGCCSRPCRRSGRRPGGRSAATTSGSRPWPCSATSTRRGCFPRVTRCRPGGLRPRRRVPGRLAHPGCCPSFPMPSWVAFSRSST